MGPRSFEQNESDYFFGRDEEIEILSSLVLSRRAVLFFAQSGAGKSSLLRAGLIPDLTKQEEVGRGRRKRTYQKMWVLPISSVGGAIPSHLEASMANIYSFSALYSMFSDADPTFLTALTLAQGLTLFFAQGEAEESISAEVALPQASTKVPPDMPVLLILDQFEELFTQHTAHWSDRGAFFRQVAQAIEAYPNLHVLFSMREDYIAELTPYARLMPDQLRSQFRLERLKQRTALQAIEQPAAQAGRFFDDGVAQSLVDNLRRTQKSTRIVPLSSVNDKSSEAPIDPEMQANSIPTATTGLGEYVEPVHLQIVCHQLWDNLPKNEVIIFAEDVQNFGDVDQALTSFYEDTLAKVTAETPVGERQLRLWFDRHAITPAHTRGLVYRGETETSGLPNAAIDVLNDAYIIRATIRGNDTWYELAHDRLVEPIWAANKTWQASYHNPLATAYQAWLASGRNTRHLLRGSQLIEAQAFVENNPQDTLPEEATYLATSIRYLNPLSLATQLWLDEGRSANELLTGPQLDQAKSYAQANADTISQEERGLLDASIQAEQSALEAASQQNYQRRILYITGAITVTILIIFSTIAYRSADSANRNAVVARAAADVAETAKAEANELAQAAQESAADALTQKSIAESERDKAETAQVIADIQRVTAEAASTLAIQQQQTAEAESTGAAQAREELVSYIENQLAQNEVTPTPTETPLPTATAISVAVPTEPTATPTPTPTPTVNFDATATTEALQAQLVKINATQTAVALNAAMAYVAGGPFLMGSLHDSSQLPGLDRNPEPQADEFPQRTVILPDFWIDFTEVSNADYRTCVNAGVCAAQTSGDFNYHTSAQFFNYPAVFISWQDAETYCRWRGKRLPTEAEWEKAARGTDGRIWPWGNRLQDDASRPVQRANVSDSNLGHITEVDDFPNGASPYGVLNMTGNIWEWTRDWYKFTYYQERPDPDIAPLGPTEVDSAGKFVIRGGAYHTPGIGSRTAERNAVGAHGSFDIGFRCAISAEDLQ